MGEPGGDVERGECIGDGAKQFGLGQYCRDQPGEAREADVDPVAVDDREREAGAGQQIPSGSDVDLRMDARRRSTCRSERTALSVAC